MKRLQQFVACVEGSLGDDEEATLARVVPAMRELVGQDDWLPPEMAVPHPEYYRQFLLHLDPRGRFSVVSFVWGPGQATPIHDHTTWGVIGMLRGSELSQAYARTPQGMVPAGEEEVLRPGEVVAVSPRLGDIHRVRNAHADRVSISIHAYGADIGQVRRHVFDPRTAAVKEFVSGYSNARAGSGA